MMLFLNVVVFWLVATRLTGFFLLAPGILDMQIPMLVRGAIVVWLACFMTPLVSMPAGMGLSWDGLLTALGAEFLFGLGLGMVTRLVLVSVQVGGALLDNELSLSAAQQLSPQAGISGGVMARVLLLVGLAFFWASDYMSVLLLGIQKSFSVLPLGQAGITEASLNEMVRLGAELFAAGLIIASPIAILSFIVTLSLGFLSRAVQQLNVFYESFTLRVVVGLSGLILFLPLVLLLTRYWMEQMLPAAADYFKAMV